MRRRLTSLGLLAFLGLGTMAFAQITGVVNDANNFPESDVEVTVKGTDKVAYTDENGNFNIDAKVGDTLVINGKEFKVTSNNLGALNYSTSENVDLDEVVVTSIFDAPQKSGQTTVTGEQLKNMNPSLSVDQMLGGKVSGLNSVANSGAPGATALVTIRGAMGLNGGVKSPLYVVDGTYMTQADINTINPLDIEDVRVLKDASQVAVYGSRGANGVIIIKTRGAKRNSTSVSFSSRIGFNEMMKQPNLDIMNANQLLNYQNDLSGLGLGLGISRTAAQISDLSENDHKWSDDMFKKGIVTSHYFNIASNTGDASQSFSIGYDKNSGAVEYYKGFERITSNLNISAKLSDKAKYGINLNGSYQTLDSPRDRNNGQSPFWNVLQNQPYAPLYSTDANGNVINNSFGDPVFNPNINSMGYSSMDEMRNTVAGTRSFKLYGSGFFEYELFKNLYARTTFGATYNREQYESFLRPVAVLAGILGNGGTKTDRSIDRFDYNWRNEINYIKSWNKNSVRATIASEFIDQRYYRLTLNSQGYPNNVQDVQSLATTKLQSSATERWGVTRFGYLGSVSYDYDRKYFVDGYIRRDGTSLAGVNSRYGTFWGASLAWDIAREEFLKGNKIINSLTLKASYGEVGDDSAIGRYANLTLMNMVGTYNNLGIAVPFSGLIVADPNLTWETNKKLNLGVDFALLNRQLTGTVSYFNDKRSDFIFNRNLPRETGSYITTTNAGELVTKGVEVELNYDIVNTKDLGISIYGTLTSMDYVINDLNGDEELFVSGSVEDMIHVKGGKPYQFYMVRYAGVNSSNGNAQYLDKDGNITETYNASDAVATGKTPFPKLMGGYGINVRYKGFDLNADFVYTFGGYTYNNTYSILTNPIGVNNKSVDAADYWKNPGDIAKFKKPDGRGNEYSTQFLEKNDYISFRSLSLGYNFDDLLQGTGIKSLRLFAQIQNLALWTKFHGNPVVGTGGSENITVNDTGFVPNSFSLFSYPLTTTYSLGFNINF